MYESCLNVSEHVQTWLIHYNQEIPWLLRSWCGFAVVIMFKMVKPGLQPVWLSTGYWHPISHFATIPMETYPVKWATGPQPAWPSNMFRHVWTCSDTFKHDSYIITRKFHGYRYHDVVLLWSSCPRWSNLVFHLSGSHPANGIQSAVLPQYQITSAECMTSY